MRLGVWLVVLVESLLLACIHATGDLSRRNMDAHLPYAVLPTDPLSIHDLELSNVLLVTTVDGRLHGLDRASGRTLWSLDAAASTLPHGSASPLVVSTYDHRTMEQLARDAQDRGDPTLIHALQGDGLYIVEPSSGGDLYVLRVPRGAAQPMLEKLPFSLPELVALSPFTLDADDQRIFVAQKHTSLMELNVFTGTVRAVYSSDAAMPPMDTRSVMRADTDDDSSSAHADKDDALESPWVYIGRTDYTLHVHARHAPHAMQTLHYHVYVSNAADRDVVALWHQARQPADHRAVLAAPETASVVCYDLRLAKNPARHATQPLPPVLWSVPLEAQPVDVYDVVFAPSAADAPLLRPALVPHDPGVLSTIFEQHVRGHSDIGAFLGLAPDGSLYALGSARYPLASVAEPAKVQTLDEARDTSKGILHAWIGGYNVHKMRMDRDAIPLLGGAEPVLQLEGARHVPAAPWFGHITLRNVAQLLGFAVFVLIVVRGCYLLWRETRVKYMDTSRLCFDEGKKLVQKAVSSEAEKGALEIEPMLAAAETSSPKQSEKPSEPPSQAEEASVHKSSGEAPVKTESTAEEAPEEGDTKRRRRRRGKRAGAAVNARQAKREDSEPPAMPTSDLSESTTASQDTPNEPSPTSLKISDEILGYGSSGTVVFRGTFQGRAVAVKRLLRDFVDLASKEVSLLQSADNHPNVIRYFCQELTPNFLFIALEECPASLADLIDRPLDHAHLASLLEPRTAFRQITAGLQHLHSLSIVHRDIKPGNILVSLTPQNKLRVLLSDFGLSKRIDGVTFSVQSQSAHAGGTMGWRAPELLRGSVGGVPADPKERLTRAVDIFSLGCVAYYMLTRGAHPFGEMYEREMHILQNKMDLSVLTASGDDTVEAQALIEHMLAPEPIARPSAAGVARHPFFWTASKRVAFLQDVSDRFETLERTPPSYAVELLEKNALAVVGSDWRRRFDRTFLEDLGKFRTYNSASVQDLLRVLRNKKHHFQDLPPALKKQLAPMPEGFLLYFTRRFPALFLHVYQVMEQLPQLRCEPTFTMYYDLDESS